MPTTVMVVVIVAIVMGCLAGMVSEVMKYKKRKLDGIDKALVEQLEQKLAQAELANAELTKRVEVLEAIVTDSGFDLDREIRNLG